MVKNVSPIGLFFKIYFMHLPVNEILSKCSYGVCFSSLSRPPDNQRLPV